MCNFGIVSFEDPVSCVSKTSVILTCDVKGKWQFVKVDNSSKGYDGCYCSDYYETDGEHYEKEIDNVDY